MPAIIVSRGKHVNGGRAGETARGTKRITIVGRMKNRYGESALAVSLLRYAAGRSTPEVFETSGTRHVIRSWILPFVAETLGHRSKLTGGNELHAICWR